VGFGGDSGSTCFLSGNVLGVQSTCSGFSVFDPMATGPRVKIGRSVVHRARATARRRVSSAPGPDRSKQNRLTRISCSRRHWQPRSTEKRPLAAPQKRRRRSAPPPTTRSPLRSKTVARRARPPVQLPVGSPPQTAHRRGSSTACAVRSLRHRRGGRRLGEGKQLRRLGWPAAKVMQA
jgi:hypothetical protein